MGAKKVKTLRRGWRREHFFLFFQFGFRDRTLGQLGLLEYCMGTGLFARVPLASVLAISITTGDHRAVV